MANENTGDLFDSLEESLAMEELTNDNFDMSLSPCMISKTFSKSDSEESDIEEVAVPQERPSKPREVYLVTYSQADVLKVQSREKFAEIVCAQFNRNDNVVKQWVVSIELHRQSGVHYHLALKLNCARRFKQVRENLKNINNIDVDFQEWHDNYYSAYTYVTKFDTHFKLSENHPVLTNPPVTARATSAKRALAIGAENIIPEKKAPKPYKPPKITRETVGEIIIENNIRSDKELYAFAKTQSNEGKNDLKIYLHNHPTAKHHTDLITTVWRIEESLNDMNREKKDRLQILEEAMAQPCAIDVASGNSCGGAWLESALETLSNNGIDRERFSKIIKNSLKYGRGKGRNLMICGPTNCAKSFILMPLTKIYSCFMTPSQGTYNWVDAPEKEVIFLNDIRYEFDGEKKVMPWNMFLNLLEGATVNISLPKTFFAKDCEWTAKQPIFATADKPILRIHNGKLDIGETQQMAERWEILKFEHQYLGRNANYDLIPCSSCFAKLILDI